MPVFVELSESTAAGEGSSAGVSLLLERSVELCVEAGKRLSDRLGVPESDAGCVALGDTVIVTNWDNVVVGAGLTATLCVIANDCDGVPDPEGDGVKLACGGDGLAACDDVCPWLAACKIEAVCEPVQDDEAAGARDVVSAMLADAVPLAVLVTLEVMLGEGDAPWVPEPVVVTTCDGVRDALPPRDMAWLCVATWLDDREGVDDVVGPCVGIVPCEPKGCCDGVCDCVGVPLRLGELTALCIPVGLVVSVEETNAISEPDALGVAAWESVCDEVPPGVAAWLGDVAPEGDSVNDGVRC